MIQALVPCHLQPGLVIALDLVNVFWGVFSDPPPPDNRQNPGTSMVFD